MDLKQMYEQKYLDVAIELGMEDEFVAKRDKKTKEYIVTFLHNLADDIKNDNLKKYSEYYVVSPAGDCMGSDNCMLNITHDLGFETTFEDIIKFEDNC